MIKPRNRYRLRTEQTESFVVFVGEEPIVRERLMALKNHDSSIYCHSCRTALLAVDLGFENKLDNEALTKLCRASLGHDLGKLGTPLNVLNKKGKLTGLERRLMEFHSVLGAYLAEDLGEDVRDLILGSHEYQDGAYPRNGGERRKQLRGTDRRDRKEEWFLESAQILAVADQYDSLTQPRPYKGRMGRGEAAKIMLEQLKGVNLKYVRQVALR